MPHLYAGIDLGGTKIAGALADESGQIVVEQTVSTESHLGPTAVLNRITGLVQSLADEAGQQPVALGLGVPGLADVSSGVVKFLPNLPTNWRDVPARAHLEPKIGCPVYLLNDARMAALGELTFGRGRGVQTMAFYTLGTGIGGGVVIDGKLRLGPLGAAGELGHQTILPHGPRCGCGNTGCLETLAGGPALTAEGVRLLLSGQTSRLYEIVDGNPARVSPREMAQAAAEGDEAVRRVLLEAAEYLAIGIANVVSTLHPELVVLGGSVADIGPLLFNTLRERVPQRVGMFPAHAVRIEPAALGNKAGLLGGIALAARGGLIKADA